MRGALKAVVAIVVVLIALAVVNMLVLDSQTKPAAVTADGGSIESASSVDLQVFDSPATGSGPEGAPIVLLHCFGCSSQWWNPILAKLNERHRVIRVDLVGHGGSEKPQSGYEIDTQGAAVAEALNSLGVQGAVVVGPPSAFSDRWARRFHDPLPAFASGWMLVRQRAKQLGVELPLVISDHCDWPELTETISELKPGEVWVTHGREEALVRWCELQGIAAKPLHLIGYEDEGD